MTDAADDPWDEYAAEWDDDEGARLYATSAYGHLIELLDGNTEIRGAVVCDFGCGTGLLTERLAIDARRVDAVDTSPAMLTQLDQKAAVRGWTNVVTSPSLPPVRGRHDLVVAASVLSFVEDLLETVADLAALLRPGGFLIHWDWERTAAHDHGLTRTEIRSALTAVGLVGVRSDRAFPFPIDGQVVYPVFGVGRRADR